MHAHTRRLDRGPFCSRLSRHLVFHRCSASADRRERHPAAGRTGAPATSGGCAWRAFAAGAGGRDVLRGARVRARVAVACRCPAGDRRHPQHRPGRPDPSRLPSGGHHRCARRVWQDAVDRCRSRPPGARRRRRGRPRRPRALRARAARVARQAMERRSARRRAGARCRRSTSWRAHRRSTPASRRRSRHTSSTSA